MEAKRSSKKRKQPSPSSNPFIGTFTRSKSQIYIHRHRSGRARSDFVCKINRNAQLDSSKSSLKRELMKSSLTDKLVNQDGDISRNTIKDLRSRRVFSPALSIDASESAETKLFSNGKDPNFNVLVPNLAEIVESCLRNNDDVRMDEDLSDSISNGSWILEESCVEKVDEIGLLHENVKPSENVEIEKTSDANPKLCSEKGNGNKGTDSDGSMPDRIFDFSEECVQTTPPDSDVVREAQVIRSNMEHRNISTYRNRSVLNPCSRRKVFKTPNSFGYKRLLPYLMDIAKDDSCSSRNGQSPKLEKGLKVNPTVQLLNSHNQEIFIDRSSEDIVTQPKVILNPGNPNLTSPEHTTEFQMLVDLQKDQPLKDKMVISEQPSELELAHDNVSPIHGSCVHNKNDVRVCSDERTLIEKDKEMCDPSPNGSSILEKFCLERVDETGVLVEDVKPSENGKKSNRRDNDEAMSNQIDDFSEKCVQMTPPDSDIFGKAEVNVNRGGSKEHVQGMLPDGGSSCRSRSRCIDKATHASTDQRTDCNPKSNLALKPCSRLKVFKTPSSFNYKRMLPYLMDIAKDNAYASRNGQSPILEKGLEVKPTPQCYSHHQEISIEGTPVDIFPIEPDVILNPGSPNSTSPKHTSKLHFPVDLQNEQSSEVELIISDKPSKLELAHDNGTPIHPSDPPVMLSCSPIEPDVILNPGSPNSTSPKHTSKLHFPVDLQNEQSSEVELIISDKPSKLELARDNGTPIHPSDTPVMLSCSPVNPEPLHGEVSQCSPDDAEKDNKVSALKLSQSETIVSTVLPEVGLTKGILKRNPRGCRGICTCLNCASFRLHAERAFEFSRNQMLDAEEVALELITELSQLRTMLKKSADGANDHPVIQVNQVREACEKASKVEDVAKARLNQMNCDLNNHCRMKCLQRPKVTFSSDVKENVVSEADMPSI